MEEKKKRSKLTIALVVIGILLIVGIVVGLSYAYWTYTASQKTVNKITSDCIEVTITDETAAINLEKTYPISDAEAANLSPYTFKVTNTCNMASSYSINLEVMDVADRLSSNLVAVSFNGGAKSILSSNTSVDVTYDEDDYTAIEAYNLGSGELAGGASESYTLKLWIDESATNNDSMKKTFISKITVTSAATSQIEEKTICKRATTLHTEKCYSEDGTGCLADGYTSGATITYGNLGTAGTLASGDAFDCDVNGDGTYDSTTERFYYVSDYYDTETEEFDTSYSTLIYYNNVSGGVPSNTATYAYDLDDSDETSPVTAMLQLPTTSQWRNVRLKNTTRTIYGVGSRIANYTGYAARILMGSEVYAGCYDGTTAIASNGGLSSKCKYLMENTQYADPSLTLGHWLEDIYYQDGGAPEYIDGKYRFTTGSLYCDVGNVYAVRPAIDVAKTNIEY